MANSDGFVSFVLEQLDGLGDVTAKAMFGGHGLYLGPVFFGLVYDDRVYLKTDEETRGWYEERGMGTFRPNERQDMRSFHEVPPDTVEDPGELVGRAETAVRTVEAAGGGRRSS
jgi:DNA transformation protein